MRCVVVCDEAFNIFGCLVVQFVELWTIAPGSEEVVDVVVCSDEFSAMTGFDWVGLDVICVDNIKNDDVVVSLAGCDWEASSLICEELTFDFC